MGKASRDKGASFERKICKVMGDAYGVELRRTPLSGGWAQHYDDVAGDVVAVKGKFPYCVECKNSEGWKLESLFTDKHAWFDAWWNQVLNACPWDKTPLLVFSKNFTPIFVAISLVYLGDDQYMEASYMVLDHPDDDIVIMLLEDFIRWDTKG